MKSIGEKAFEESAIESIILPEGLTTLGLNTFWYCRSLKSVVLPSTLETIPQWCFSNCTALESVTLPPTLKKIGSEAFHNCSSLTEITIPASVTSFGAQNGAFNGCSGLQTINFEWTENIPDGLKNQFDNEVISAATIGVPKGCEAAYGTALYPVVNSSNIVSPSTGRVFTSVVDGQTLTFKITDDEAMTCQVGDGENIAIADATYTGALSLPTTATYLGSTFTVTVVAANAFKNVKMTSLALPATVTVIGNYAFYGNALTTVSLPYVQQVGDYAFAGVSEDAKGSLTTVSFAAPVGARASSPAETTEPSVAGETPALPEARNGAPRRVKPNNLQPSIGSHAFENNNISSLDLGSVQSADDFAFYNNNMMQINTQDLRYIGDQCFGKNPIKGISLGEGLQEISDANTTVTTEGGNPFGLMSEASSVTTVVAGGVAHGICMSLFCGTSGKVAVGIFAAGCFITAVSAIVWASLREGRKNVTDEDKAKNEDKFSFTLSESEGTVNTYVTYTIEMPAGASCSVGVPEGLELETSLRRIILRNPGTYSVTATFRNSEDTHYDTPTITVPLTVKDEDTPEEQPDDNKKQMFFNDRIATTVRDVDVDMKLTYVNITPAEAAGVEFKLSLNNFVDENENLHWIDEALVSKLKVEKMFDPEDGYPYAHIKVSDTPLTVKTLLGLGRFITATLVTGQEVLTDRARVVCASVPNPPVILFRDTVQVGDVIALPPFNEFFPTCYALTPFAIPLEEGGGLATKFLGYGRYSKPIIMNNEKFLRGVPIITYIDDSGFQIPGGGVSAHSKFELQTTSKLVWPTIGPTIWEEQVDTIIVCAKSEGVTRLRFSDPFFANLYFDMEVVCVAPATTNAEANPCKWDFTKPVDAEHYLKGYEHFYEIPENLVTFKATNTSPYWHKEEGYYSSDLGYYPREWTSKDTRKWAPFYSNTGRNLPQFEGITASIVTDDTDWHKPIDRIRLYDNRAEGEAQVAFIGQTDLCIKKPTTLTGYSDTHKVPFIVNGNMLKDAEVTCSYTYNDGSAQNYSQTRTFSAAANDETLEFELDDRMTTDITLSVKNVELKSLLIKAPLPDVTDHGIRYTYSTVGNGYEASGFDKDDADANNMAGTDGKYALTLNESLTVDETEWPVIAIADGAFTDSRLSSVHIPHTDPSTLTVGENAFAFGVTRYVPMASLKAYVLNKPLWVNDLFTDYKIPSAGIGAPALDAPVYVSSADGKATVWIIKDNGQWSTVNGQSDEVYVIHPEKVSDNVANANEGILIRGTAGSTVSMKFQTYESKDDYTGNLLKANITAQHIDNSAGNCYGMSKGEFWLLPNAGKFPANRSYLQLPAAIGGARSLVIDWYDNESVDISETVNSKLSNSQWYDLQGRRMEPSIFRSTQQLGSSKNLHSSMLKKGVYIHHGKKVVIK